MHLKTFISVILLALATTVAVLGADKEKTLFDSEGEAVAYIALDDELNIYLWKGEPVAYLKREAGDTHIYGFNGDHLGWFEKGVVYNSKGRAVGFVDGAVNKLKKLEPLKGLRKLTPLKALEKLAPLKPLLKSEFSDTPLKAFLLQGSKDH
jgi:hypothetical protein